MELKEQKIELRFFLILPCSLQKYFLKFIVRFTDRSVNRATLIRRLRLVINFITNPPTIHGFDLNHFNSNLVHQRAELKTFSISISICHLKKLILNSSFLIDYY